MASSERPHLIIGICTFRRPEMLRRCLASVLAQECPEGWKVEIVVVDNDAQSDLAEMISRAFPDPKYPIRYFIEPRRGIPHARNAVCRHALSVKADLIAFIDDDEEADPGWLMAYARGVATYEAQAYTGPVRYIFPPGYEDWLANKGFAETKHGALLKGLVRCKACGCAMSHHFATRGNKRYRYYVCIRAQKNGWSECPSPFPPPSTMPAI